MSIAHPSAPDSTTVGRVIELTLPAHTDVVATLRVLVASLGADVGFDVDEIDDVRLAVSEVFSVAADASADRFMTVFRPSAGALEIEMLALHERIELDPLARTILDTVVDELEIGSDHVTIVKRAQRRD